MEWNSSSWWSGTRAPIDRAIGLPPAAYTDPSFHGDERDRVFRRAWVGIGLAAEVAEPGRLLVRALGDRSVLVTRGTDGLVRGFLNSCRHRGTELAAADCDIASTIRCPYHRWGYALDGRLIAAPRFEDVPRVDFDPSELGLMPVRVESWGCLLFACLDPAAPALSEWLGDLPTRMAGYELDGWYVQFEQRVDIAANWKLVAENFQEYYHLAWVHPELAKVSRVDDHYRYQGPGMYCGQTTTPVSGDDRGDWLAMPPTAGLDASDGCSGRFVSIFPNVLLSVLPNHAFVIRLEPLAPDHTIEHCAWLLPPTDTSPDPGAFEATRSFWVDINAEDIDIVQRGQRGLSGGAVAAGPLSPRFEEPLHRFHNMLADCMTLPSLADLRVPPGDRPGDDERYGTRPNPTPPRR